MGKFCEKSKSCALSLVKKLSGFKKPAIEKNLLTRIIASALGGSIFLFSLYLGGWTLYLLFFCLAMISSFEWHQMTKGNKWSYIPAGLIVALPYASMLYIYTLPHGALILFWLVLTVWSTDVAAYFLGKNFGRRKVMPAISPNKTWVGVWGGVVFSAISTLVISVVSGIFFVPNALVIGAVVSVVAQCGDFLESGVKRLCKVKDSGFIIPGHGGVLDRMDGFIFTAPMVAFYIRHVSKFFAGV